jgi:SPP1 family predicted phage head-tail adaptor
MNAGKYNQLVTIQTPIETTDSVGGKTVTWSDVRSTFAAVRPISAREQQAAAQLQPVAQYRLEMRSQTVTTRERLRWDSAGGAILNIRSVAPAGRGGGEIVLTAESGVGD